VIALREMAAGKIGIEMLAKTGPDAANRCLTCRTSDPRKGRCPK
jgi:hypothetical protein